jgi:WD40 repeat protein
VAISGDGSRVAAIGSLEADARPERTIDRAAASRDATDPHPTDLIVWDRVTGDRVASLQIPWARHVAISRDGSLVAAAGQDRVSIWNATGTHRATTTGQPGPITCLAFGPDGSLIAAGGSGAVCTWDTATGQRRQALKTTPTVTTIAFSPPSAGPGRMATVGFEGVVQIWDAATGHDLFTLRSLAPARPLAYSFPARVTFSRDGQRIAANNWDGSFNLWLATPVQP